MLTCEENGWMVYGNYLSKSKQSQQERAKREII